MRIRVHAEWADIARSRDLATGEHVTHRFPPRGALDLRFAPGSEHILWLRSAAGDWCSGVFFTGPCTAASTAVLRPHPLALRSVDLDLPKEAIGIDSYFHAGWHEVPLDTAVPDAGGRAGLHAFCGAHGLTTWLRILTAAGPFQFPCGSAPPAGYPWPVRLPDLSPLKVQDSEGRPVPDALVALAWDGKGGLPPPYLVFQGQADLGSTWEAGLTDVRGRIAVPSGLLRTQDVLVLAWGFRAWRGRLAPDTGTIALERDRIIERVVDFRGCGGAVFANDPQNTVHCAPLRPRFAGGRFHIPAQQLRDPTDETPPWFANVAVLADLQVASGGALEYASPSGYSFRLDQETPPGERIVPRRRVRRASSRPAGKGGLFRFGRVPGRHGLQGTRLLGGRPAVPVALCRTSASGATGTELPVVFSASVTLELPGCATTAFHGDAARADLENGHADELRFEAERGLSTWIVLQGPDGQPVRGARLVYYIEGRHRQAEEHAKSQAGQAPKSPFLMLRGSVTPQEGGRFEVRVPRGCRLAFAAEAPGLAPVFGRVDAGREHTIRAREPAFALVRGVTGMLMVRCLSVKSGDMDPDVLRNLMPGSPRFAFRAPLSLLGCDVPTVVGPLPGGSYEFQILTLTGAKQTRRVTLEPGKPQEIDL